MKKKTILCLLSLFLMTGTLLGCKQKDPSNDEPKEQEPADDPREDPKEDPGKDDPKDDPNDNPGGDDPGTDPSGDDPVNPPVDPPVNPPVIDPETCNHIDEDKDYICDICKTQLEIPVVKVLTVSKFPKIMRYKIGEEFSSNGLKVMLSTDGISKSLNSSEYQIDSSSFNNQDAGEYEINISLIENPNVKTSFTVSVVKVTSYESNSNYRNFFILHEEVAISDTNLKVYKIYSDGEKEEFTEAEYADLSFKIDTETPGNKTSKVIYKNNEICSLTYFVSAMADATVKSISKPENLPEVIASTEVNDFVSNCGDLYCDVNVEFVEIPNKTFLAHASIDCSSLLDASAPGLYSIKFTVNGISINESINVVDISDYTFIGFQIEGAEKYKLFELEDVAGLRNALEIYMVYELTGVDNSKISLKVSNESFECTSGSTENYGDNLEFTFESSSYGQFKITKDVLPLLITPNGDYVRVDASEGITMWDPFVRVIDNKWYVFAETNDGYGMYESTINTVEHFKNDSNEYVSIQLVYKDSDENEYDRYVHIDVNTGLLFDYEHFDSNDMLNIYVPDSEMYIYAYVTKGKLSKEAKNTISSFGELYQMTESGDPADSPMNLDGEISGGNYIMVFAQQDATGQQFLGTYVADTENGVFFGVRIDADGLFFLMDETLNPEYGVSGSFTYEPVEGGYKISTNMLGIVIHIQGDKLTFAYSGTDFEFSLEK